ASDLLTQVPISGTPDTHASRPRRSFSSSLVVRLDLRPVTAIHHQQPYDRFLAPRQNKAKPAFARCCMIKKEPQARVGTAQSVFCGPHLRNPLRPGSPSARASPWGMGVYNEHCAPCEGAYPCRTVLT